MNVAQLIHQLGRYDDDLEVRFSDNDETTAAICSVSSGGSTPEGKKTFDVVILDRGDFDEAIV